MGLLDVQTIVFSYVVMNIICVWFIVPLWRQSRNRYAGMDFLAIDFIFQAAALVLIILRGAIPGWMSLRLSDSPTDRLSKSTMPSNSSFTCEFSSTLQ